jgi:hypothetical protein
MYLQPTHVNPAMPKATEPCGIGVGPCVSAGQLVPALPLVANFRHDPAEVPDF